MLFLPIRRQNDYFYFDENDVNHLKKVLRKKSGDQIICLWENQQYLAQISSLSPFCAQILELKQMAIRPFSQKIGLFQAVIKPKHFEWILAKSVEIGIDYFYPTLFNYSQSNRLEAHDRLQKIVKSAIQQSMQTNQFFLNQPLSFKQSLIELKTFNHVIVAYEKADDQYYLSDCLSELKLKDDDKIAIIIGPEGGFSDHEIVLLSQFSNVYFVRLTSSILRSETASLYCLSLLFDYLIRYNQKKYETN